jgi:hypothetical protein
VTVNAALINPTISASPNAINASKSATPTTTTPFSGGTPTYSCLWLQEAPGTTGFSTLGSSFLCSAGTAYGITTGPLSTKGLWSFELMVTDSADPAVVVTSNVVTVTVG